MAFKTPFRIGKEKIDALLLQAQEAQSCLEMDPKTTLNYVNYLSFLENAPKMVRIGSVLWYMNKCFLKMTVWNVMSCGMVGNLPCGMVDNYQHFKEASTCHEVFPEKAKIGVSTEAHFSLSFLISSSTSTHNYFRL